MWLCAFDLLHLLGLSYSCGVDYEEDEVYQKEMAVCNERFASSYPRQVRERERESERSVQLTVASPLFSQEKTLETREEYKPQTIWGRLLDRLQK